jgi:LmbE family N-acetylglucosaminyl deacetylase
VTVTSNLPTPASALAIGAHPDDVEFGCGGTLAKWAAGGCEIHHLVCTDGSKGSWSPEEDVAALVTTRQEEQRAASRALGGRGDVVFLRWVDGELEAGIRQRSEVCYWIRRLRPEVVLGHDPWRRYRLHPDHRAAGFLATDGFVAAREPHFFPEQQIAPHRPSKLLLWEADEPDHVEDIGDYVESKFTALLAHRSQYLTTMEIADESVPEQLARFRDRVVERAADHGSLAGIAYGERFKRLP